MVTVEIPPTVILCRKTKHPHKQKTHIFFHLEKWNKKNTVTIERNIFTTKYP